MQIDTLFIDDEYEIHERNGKKFITLFNVDERGVRIPVYGFEVMGEGNYDELGTPPHHYYEVNAYHPVWVNRLEVELSDLDISDYSARGW